ncbi:uncharacterized protein LOC143203863 [Rhynchophorus ferrugineus]|uniref:uncharacterized protein LOC143203863 n=1 Tax=Rhynchophorus ferrugineus TaxID=354439 RepID=UPI003FCDE5AB
MAPSNSPNWLDTNWFLFGQSTLRSSSTFVVVCVARINFGKRRLPCRTRRPLIPVYDQLRCFIPDWVCADNEQQNVRRQRVNITSAIKSTNCHFVVLSIGRSKV